MESLPEPLDESYKQAYSMPVRWAPLGLLVVALFAVPVLAANVSAVLDPAAIASVQKRWPRALGTVERRLTEPSGEFIRDRPAVVSTLNAAASFLEADRLPEAARADARAAAVRDFRAGLDALGPHGGRFLARDGGLGEIAREVLGDAALLTILNQTAGDKPETSGLLSVRAEALYHAGRYQEAAAAALQAWELSGRKDEDAFVLLKLSEGRTNPTQSAGLNPGSPSGTTASNAVANRIGDRPSILTGRPPKQAPLIVPAASPQPGQESDNDRVTSLQNLELEKSAYDGLRAAVSAAPMPISAARSAFDRPLAVVDRDLKLRQAAQAASEWLDRSRDPQARELLEALGDSRRKTLADAVNRASIFMDRSEAGREDARIRSALMGQDAAPESREEAAQALLAMRRQDPGYFQAKAAALDYVRFNREHLADFPGGTRFSGAELGMEPPPDSGLASIEYETTKDGRLVPARLVSADGSARERGEVAGAWTIRDKSGAVTGWTLEAGAFAAIEDIKARGEAVAAAARWLSSQGFKPGGRDDQAETAASFLSDMLGRPDAGVKGVQVYADRAEGRISMDAYYGQGVKQRVARLEPGESGQAPVLALYERAVTDPNDATTPWRRVMLYRGAAERELLTTKAVSNGESLRRVVTGTTVELLPVAVRYRREADGRWTRDGQTREFQEQRQVIHDSAGVIGGSGEVLGVAGRGATDLAASALAAGGALSLYPARAIPRAGSLVAEVQQDWFERANVNLVNNAVSTELGERYEGDAYRGRKAAMNLDERKYVQNVRRELTDQGHPMLGAVTGAGVGFANSVLPMAAGLGALHGVAKLNVAGNLAAKGVGLIMSGKGGWDAGIAINELNRARTHFDERDPRSVADYYTAVQNLGEHAVGQAFLLAGVRDVLKTRASAKVATAEPIAKPGAVTGEKMPFVEQELGKRAAATRALEPPAVVESESIAAIGKKTMVGKSEQLTPSALRQLYEYSGQRRDVEFTAARETALRLGITNPEITSLIKGQPTSKGAAASFEAFQEGVREKIHRKRYPTPSKMTDMSRGRVSLDNFDEVMKYALETARTREISGVTYPSAAPPEFVAEMKKILGSAKVKEHKALNSDNPRIHVDLVDPKTNFVYELQVGTKRFNHFMQEHFVVVPEELVPIFAKIDPHGIAGGKANLHLVNYDGIMKLTAANPEFIEIPIVKEYLRNMSSACRVTGFDSKPADIRLVGEQATDVLSLLYKENPSAFKGLAAHDE